MPTPSEAEIEAAMRLAYDSAKVALPPLDWKVDRQAQNTLRCPIVCQCADLRLTGVEIRGTAYADRANEHVSLQLLIDFAGRDYRIARIDWRPRSPHTNRYGGPGVRGATIYGSQIHDFADNVALGLQIMQNSNLPICAWIDPDPSDFTSLMRYVGERLGLTNASEIPVPPWSPMLPSI